MALAHISEWSRWCCARLMFEARRSARLRESAADPRPELAWGGSVTLCRDVPKKEQCTKGQGAVHALSHAKRTLQLGSLLGDLLGLESTSLLHAHPPCRDGLFAVELLVVVARKASLY